MTSLENRWKDYWQKSSKSKIASDIFFVSFLVAMFVPASRMAITVFVRKLTLMPPDLEIPADAPELGQAAWLWQIRTLDGQPLALEHWKGKAIFLNYWATWCPPCVAEMPSIELMHQQLKDLEQVAIVLVSNEEPAVIREFLDRKGFTMPVYTLGTLPPEPLRSNVMPTSFVISPDGRLVFKETGTGDWGDESSVEFMRELSSLPATR